MLCTSSQEHMWVHMYVGEWWVAHWVAIRDNIPGGTPRLCWDAYKVKTIFIILRNYLLFHSFSHECTMQFSRGQ